MFLSSFIQYNNESDQVASNIRFRFIHRPLSDIYVVYNDVRDRRRDTAVLHIAPTDLYSVDDALKAKPAISAALTGGTIAHRFFGRDKVTSGAASASTILSR